MQKADGWICVCISVSGWRVFQTFSSRDSSAWAVVNIEAQEDLPTYVPRYQGTSTGI